MPAAAMTEVEEVRIEPDGLIGLLGVPHGAQGIVIFAHGSGSGRLSPHNNHVAAALRQAGLATLLVDLLTSIEEGDRRNVFDIDLLASRLALATHWAAASRPDAGIAAVVSRGGRPDLAMDALPAVRAPTLLLVGSLDGPVIGMNERALAALKSEKQLIIIDGAGHLFEEPGTMDEVVRHATRWFLEHLPPPQRPRQ